MSLNWLVAKHFRNLSDIHIRLSPGLNLIHGQNGSGKTSLLEAAYFLGMGRSFRDVSVHPLIQRNQEGFLIRGGVQCGEREDHLGLSRDREGNRDLRINGERVLKATEMARTLPTLALGPHSVDLLLGPPVLRRRFLNWGLFHVEHPDLQNGSPGTFTHTWAEANRCLKQRNELLRNSRGSQQEIDTWSHRLAEVSERLDQLRAEYIRVYQPIFAKTVKGICGLENVELRYYRGWKDSESLLDCFIQDTDIDKKRGFTQKGFQRADVRIDVAGLPAAKVCSRGELKGVVWSMILAQGLLSETDELMGSAASTLYLVDDLASEFDAGHRERLCQFLIAAGRQTLMTGVDAAALKAACDGAYERLFHVKHGTILEET